MKLNLKIKSRWKRREVIILLEQMGLYVSSGLPIDRTLSIVSLSCKGDRKDTILTMKRAIESGASFSRTFSEHITRDLAVAAIVGQGEVSGHLGAAFHSAKELLERSDELSKKCLSAIAYPAIIGIFAALLTIGLVKGVMPQIIPLLISLHVKLPLLTRIVIHISERFISYGLWGSIAAFIIVTIIVILYKKVHRFKSAIHALVLFTPLVGGLVRSYWLAIFLRSCGTMVESGAPVSKAYSNAASSVGLLPFRSKLSAHSESLYEGVSLAGVLSKEGMKFPPYIPALISAGEASGTLGASLIRAAGIVDRDIEHMLKRLTSLIEPVMMAGMGVAVGAIALSIMMPIYDISKVLQR